MKAKSAYDKLGWPLLIASVCIGVVALIINIATKDWAGVAFLSFITIIMILLCCGKKMFGTQSKGRKQENGIERR